MNTTGTSRASCATCFCRPMRCCSAENGSGRPSRKASTSPSSTVPSGSRAAAAAISGKRSRDQLLAARPQVDAAGALDELRADAVPLPLDQPVADGRRAAPRRGRSRAATARKNGYGRDRSSSVTLGRQQRLRTTRRSASSRPSAARRCVVGGSSAACASARTTSVCETPTRSSPVSSLSRMKRCQPIELAQPRRSRAPAAAAGSSAVAAAGCALRPTGVSDDGLRAGVERQLIEDQRRRFGAVADDRVALVEQPFGEAGRGQRPVADRRRGHAGASAGGR